MRVIDAALPSVFAAFLLAMPFTILWIDGWYALGSLALTALFIALGALVSRAGQSQSRPWRGDIRVGIYVAFVLWFIWFWFGTLELFSWFFLPFIPLMVAMGVWTLLPRRWPWVLVTGATAPLWIPVSAAVGVLLTFSWTAALGQWDTVDPSGPGPPPPDNRHPSISLDDAELARAYVPRYILASETEWRPSRIETYVDDSQTTLNERTNILAQAPLAATLEQHGHRCAAPGADCVITLNCERAQDPCAKDPAGTDRPLVYARVQRDPWGAEPGIRRPAEGILAELEVLVSYWSFYRYNQWFSNFIEQWHEGDWEAVLVGLADDRPLFVAFSAHCEGTWREWRKGQIVAFAPQSQSVLVDAPIPAKPGHHVGVFVAEGSHANYPSGDERPPLWIHCAGLRPDEAGLRGLVALTAGSHAVESFAEDELGGPTLLQPEVELETDEPSLRFPARWGTKDTTTWLGVHLDLLDGGGPKSPAQQELWTRPLHRIFCEWTESEHCPDTRVRP